MKKKNYKTKISLGILTVILLSCTIVFTAAAEIIRGSGNVIKESRTVENFKGIDVSRAIDVYLKHGSSQKVTVEADDNIVEYIETEVNSSGVLVIKTKDKINFKNSTKMNVYVTFTSLESLKASGAASIESESTIEAESFEMSASGAADIDCKLNVSKLDLDASGASDIELKGKTIDFKIDISGASSLNAYTLDADNVIADISGASDAKVNVIKSINANASGASSLKYSGFPEKETVHESGASSVRKH